MSCTPSAQYALRAFSAYNFSITLHIATDTESSLYQGLEGQGNGHCVGNRSVEKGDVLLRRNTTPSLSPPLPRA
ncbi:hypothetical protein RR46_05036 [Papilio xuthus]|uniref:Uncharacterized protein n=1 Tax=Papilio xuthus TaxID=66420 RepID=A0A194PU22_PAPXU|nr:hypothetical protein RR46_05036 [Papilio xuthus]